MTHLVDIGVGENDERALAAQLEGETLQPALAAQLRNMI